MPCFVIATEHCQVGKTIDAILCDIGPAGYPNRRTDVPIKATIGEDTLLIDNESRAIISHIGENNVATYLISNIGLRNRERRVALAKAAAALDNLTSIRWPLIESSDEHDGLAAEGLGLLYNFIAEEKERLSAPATSKRRQVAITRKWRLAASG